MNASKPRFLGLDAMRGVAALMVVLYHFREFANSAFFAHGYLSVDIFFLISGFVLTAAYGDRMQNRDGVRIFLGERLRRLGPVLWLGVILTAAAFLFAASSGGSAIGSEQLLLVCSLMVRNFVLLPLFGASPADAFPLNGVSWSLFAEIVVNIAFALAAKRLSNRILCSVVVTGWAVFALLCLRNGSANFGSAEADILLSLARAVPSFGAGILLHRLWQSGALARLPSIHPLLIFALWGALAFVPSWYHSAWFDIAAVVLVSPLMIALLANVRAAPPRWSLWLGGVSYPLYATHLAFRILGLRSSAFGVPGHIPAPTVLALVLLALGLAHAVHRYFEPAVARLWQRPMAWPGARPAISAGFPASAPTDACLPTSEPV